MADLGLLQAWDMWFNNVQVNQHTLYGWSILALGRVGKIAAFVGGLSVVLDLVGPERLRQFGARYGNWEVFRSRRLPLMLAFLVFSIGTIMILAVAHRDPAWFAKHLEFPMKVIMVLWVAVIIPAVMPFTVRGIARALEHERAERVIRIAGVVLLVVGFHFDLLAS